MKKLNLQETKSARVIQVIETVSLAGDGTDAQPVYEVHQYWSLDGKLLAKSKPPVNQDGGRTLKLNKEECPPCLR